ncbi:MAG: tetratricopeptide repeat protein [Terracidiphilus sp.]|jgi:tetratricopeptide (TPR) repeat protein
MMGNLRKWGIRWILSAACIGIAATAHATCTGPQTMTAKLHAQPTTENAIQLGSWFAGRRQFQCAAEIFRAALKADPQSAQLNYLEALALVGLGKPAAAIPSLQESIRLQADVIKPHLLLANLYEESGKQDQADEQWRLALAIDPHSDIALEGFSKSLLARKDYIGVIGLLQHAPRTETLALRLAHALDSLKHFDQASDVLSEALKSYPDSLRLATAESVVLSEKGDYLGSFKMVKNALDHHQGNHEAELGYLRILVMTMHFSEVRPEGMNFADGRPLAQKLLAESPHDAEILFLNGVLDHEVGEFAAAKAHLEEAVALDPDFSYSRFHLGTTLVALHEWQEAKENLEKAIALGNEDPKAHYQLAMALHGLGENGRAAEEIGKYKDAKQANEDNLAAARFSVHGDMNLAAGDLKGAISDYRTAAERSPKNAGYRYQLALALRKSGDTEGELAALEEAIKLNPGLAGAQKELGYLLSRSGDSVGSIEHFRMAVKAAPYWTEAWINLAAELGESGQFAEARFAVASALRLDPANAEARELSDQLAHDPAAQQSNP